MAKKFTKYPSNYTKASVDTDIAKYKKALQAKASKRGLYENFGQDEIRKLNDKYRTLPDGDTDYRTAERNRNSIKEFEDWCGSYSCYGSTEVKASESPYGYGRPQFDKEYEYEQLYGVEGNFSFDFLAPEGLDEQVVEDIISDVFVGCEINNVLFRDVDYPDWQEDYPSKPIQAGVAFTCSADEAIDTDAIIADLEVALADYGYEIIGNPEFYSA